MRILLTLVCLFTFLPAFSQLDSLKTVIEEKTKSEETVDWVLDLHKTYRHSKPQLMVDLTRIAMEMSENLSYEKGMIRSYNSLGASYQILRQFDSATTNLLKGLELANPEDHPKEIALIKTNLANVYDDLNQFHRSIQLGLEAMDILLALKDSANLVKVITNLGVAYNHNKQHDSALHFYDQAAYIHNQLGNVVGAARIKNNVGVILIKLENYDEALDYFEDGYEMIKGQNAFLEDNLLVNLGRIYTQKKDYIKAEEYLQTAIESANRKDNIDGEQLGYYYIVDVFEAMGDYKKAYDYINIFFQMYVDRTGVEVQKKVEVLQLSYENEKQEKLLALAKAQQAEDRLYKWVAISIAAFVMLVSALIIAILRIRVHKGKIKAQELEFKLTQKRKELTSYALNFIQKNELLDELMGKVNDLRRSSDTDTALGLNRINHLISDSFRIDQDWENFKLMFEEVHPDFFVRLKDRYPELGNAELKLSALLRLNMNLKESSRVLGISPDSVKTARYRLRKKLNLEHDENLVDFFIKFDGELISV